MSVPYGFKSNDEYKQYCKCFSRIEAGDMVEVYRSVYGFSLFPEKTWERIKIIGTKPDNILLGSDRSFGQFWSIRDNPLSMRELKTKVDDINQYQYAYWVWCPPNIRIKRVIKSVKPVKDVGENINPVLIPF